MVDQLTGQLLIAMPTLADPNFSKSVSLICEHSEHGAMGLTLNQSTEFFVSDLLSQLNIPTADLRLKQQPVFAGGPVQMDRGFILHDGDHSPWESSLQVSENLHLTTSGDILEKIGEGRGPEHFLVTLGYAGWGPGQIEDEIMANSWLTAGYEHQIVFQTDADQQWLAAGKKMGIDLNLLASQVGHA